MNIYPSTTYIGGTFQQASGASDVWRCSGLTQASSGLIALPTATNGTFVYGGTPSDQSIVRCIRDLKVRGFNVIFYPFLLMTAAGLPWRGEITYAPDLSSAATAAVNAFFGSATISQFTLDATNLTVAYSGSAADWTYRRMILHYANLCVVAGGVNLFVIGSELRGLETIRGPSWSKAGTTDGSGNAIWDYPFVAGLTQLAADVRSIFDAASLTRNSRRSRTSSPIPPTGRIGWGTNTRAKMANGRTSIRSMHRATSISCRLTTTCLCRTGRQPTAAWTRKIGRRRARVLADVGARAASH